MRVLGVILIVLVAIAIIAALCVLVHMSVSALRERRKRRADATVPWAAYSEPVRDNLEIGVQRRTEDGRVLAQVHMHTVPAWIELEVLVAMNDAEMRARAYNDSKVGM
jgi:hypothetical protein